MGNRLWMLCVVPALLWSGFGCDRTKERPVPEPIVRQGKRLVVPESSPLRQALQLGVAGEETINAGLTVPATIEADPAEWLKVLPPLSGRIVELHARLGDWVKQGQPLATLESPELTQALADFQRAKAQHLQAKRHVERVRELGAHDIASKKEVDQAETEYTAAEGEKQRAEGRLAQLGVPTEPGRGARHLVLRAPITGRINELAAAPGAYWNDLNAPLMVLANLTKVWFTASVQEKDIPKIAVGQAVSATLASFPGQTFHSRVAFVSEMLDPETRTVKVRAAFDNSSRQLLPAMFANVTFQLPPHKGVVIPTTAILQDANGSRVYVEVAPWTFEPRSVREGVHLGEAWTEVVEGLKPGERLVVKEGMLLHD